MELKAEISGGENHSFRVGNAIVLPYWQTIRVFEV